jgi:hypothetical protein
VRFLGPDGTVLPFESHDEILDFLKTARIVSDEPVPVGTTRPRKLVLERDGVRVRAILRQVDRVERMARFKGRQVERFFRDHHAGEVAAYALARELGMANVPPAVERRRGGRGGSVQLWIEEATTEKGWRERSHPPLEQARHRRQLYVMRVFDNLINNTDRNLGNYLTDSTGKVWLVDHTRCFARSEGLRHPDEVVRVERDFWKRLQELSDARIREVLDPYLAPPEIDSLLERRRMLINLIRKRITEQGEHGVLFDWTP